jgi:hypothetical protein
VVHLFIVQGLSVSLWSVITNHSWIGTMCLEMYPVTS